MLQLRQIIEDAFATRDTLSPKHCPPEISHAIRATIEHLNNGTYRVAEKINGTWQTHEWLKKAILLYFKIREEQQYIAANFTQFYDKIPLKFANFSEQDWQQHSIRVAPTAIVRFGAYLAPNVVLMPSYVNIGAHVDAATLVDTWATVGSCAQIGKHVHLSGGVGIGGVLEPLQSNPTIIEDHCFIGARSEIVEGVIIGEGSVLSMGVYIGQSTPIYHRQTKSISYGHVPPYSVVVPGTLPAKDGSHSLYCAVIVKQVDEKTRAKTSLNELLRPQMEL